MAMVTMISKKAGAEGPNVKTGKGQDYGDMMQEPPSLHLSHDHLSKLGLKDLKAGQKLHIHAVAHVHSAHSESQTRNPSGGKASGGEGNTKHNATLHFHKMEVGTDQQPSDAKEQGQKDGMKAAIDKALTKDAGSESAKGKAPGKTPSVRAGGD
jgi:hypothetical protein